LVIPAGLCLTALGPYAVGNVAECLSASNIGLFTAGTTLTSCLTNALSATCITSLPAECTNLATETGAVALAVDIPLCIAELGPFAIGTALTCLSTSNLLSTSAGYNVVSCLYTALNLQPYSGQSTTTVVDIPCPASGSTTCDITLPDTCKDLAGQVGLGVAVDAILCTADLGVFAVGNVLSCLATDVITTATTGNSIISCLTTALEDQCPATLPSACAKLSTDVGVVAITADIALCTLALGPYAVGDALTCLSTTGLSDSSLGSGIVSCLDSALNIVV
ncbi:hypothetical protein SEUCBS140593_004769, partial [Sporothrix eucalyptigena]